MLDSNPKYQLKKENDSKKTNRRESFIGKVGYRFTFLFSFFEDIFVYLSGFVIIFLTILLGHEVIQRKLFNRSMVGIEEIVELSMLYIAFLALSHVQKDEKHLKVDSIYNRVIKTRLGPTFRLVILSVSFVFFIFFFIFSSKFTLQMNAANEVTEILHIPKVIFYIAIPAGCFFCIIRLFLQMIKYNNNSNS